MEFENIPELHNDDQMVMISAIEHYSYCPRQCALIHVAQIFEENEFTLKGRYQHERVDTSDWEVLPGARIERALPLWSDDLGLIGKADVVEFREDGSIYPVEYKHGPRKKNNHDDLQLCAQAACLEEMFHTPIISGAIYHISSHRRREVVFTEQLRELMRSAILAIREMILNGIIPPPVNDIRCRNCSLFEVCMPEVIIEARYDWHLRDLYRLGSNSAEDEG